MASFTRPLNALKTWRKFSTLSDRVNRCMQDCQVTTGVPSKYGKLAISGGNSAVIDSPIISLIDCLMRLIP